MIKTFLATLNPMLMLFICIVVGFVLCKTKILPENAGKVMAKLETWVFCPALSFYTMAYYCTVDNIGTHATNIILSGLGVALALAISLTLSRIFVRENVYERNVYKYALAFANSGYVGDPVAQALAGDIGLAYYKLYCLPLSLVIYTWGIANLVPHDQKSGANPLKNLLNAPMIAMVLGIIVGFTGAGTFLLGPVSKPTFVGSTLIALRSCMGPVAMLLAGFTVARYNFKSMLTDVKVYVATFLRLIVIPAVIVAFVYGLKTLANLAFGLNIDNFVLYLTFFAVGAPLGLNTVVFPEAYGGDPKTGASMAMISHTLCVISIPIMYALLVALFPCTFPI